MRCADEAARAPKIAPPPHPTYSIDAVVRAALEEDVGDVGDVSSLSTIPASTRSTATLLAKATGTLAGEHLRRLRINKQTKTTTHHSNTYITLSIY